jgi:hypothetical protein
MKTKQSIMSDLCYARWGFGNTRNPNPGPRISFLWFSHRFRSGWVFDVERQAFQAYNHEAMR